MPDVSVKLIGIDDAIQTFRHISRTANDLANRRIQYGSNLPYAYGIETGFRRSGRLARRAGGAWMLRDGYRRSIPQVRSILEQGIARKDAASAVVNRIEAAIDANVKPQTPVKSSKLRNNFGLV